MIFNVYQKEVCDPLYQVYHQSPLDQLLTMGKKVLILSG